MSLMVSHCVVDLRKTNLTVEHVYEDAQVEGDCTFELNLVETVEVGSKLAMIMSLSLLKLYFLSCRCAELRVFNSMHRL